MKFLLDVGPLIAFFAAYKLYGLMAATVVLMVVTVVSIGISYVKQKKVPMMPLVTAVIVGIFGGLTIFLNDETFIKLKPTIVNLLFASALLGGAAFGKGLLKHLFGQGLPLKDEAWLSFSVRWGIFFLFMAGVNEAVWRNVSTDVWVNFKVFGLLGLSLLFTLTQIPFIKRHLDEEENSEAPLQENVQPKA